MNYKALWRIEQEISEIFKKRNIKVINFSCRPKRRGGMIYFVSVNK